MPNPQNPQYGRINLDTTKKTAPRGSQVQTDLGRRGQGGMQSGGFQFGGNSSAAFRVPDTLLNVVTKGLPMASSIATQAIDYANDWVETADRYALEDMEKRLIELESDPAYMEAGPTERAKIRQTRIAMAGEEFTSYGYKNRHELRMMEANLDIQRSIAPDAQFSISQLVTADDWDTLPTDVQLDRLEGLRSEYSSARPEIRMAIDEAFDSASNVVGQELIRQNQMMLQSFESSLGSIPSDVLYDESGNIIPFEEFRNLAHASWSKQTEGQSLQYSENEQALLEKFIDSMSRDFYGKVQQGTVAPHMEGIKARMVAQLKDEPPAVYTIEPAVLAMDGVRAQGVLSASLAQYATTQPDGFPEARARALATGVINDPAALRKYLIGAGVYETEGPLRELYDAAISDSNWEAAAGSLPDAARETLIRRYSNELKATLPAGTGNAGRRGAADTKPDVIDPDVLAKVGPPRGQSGKAEATTAAGQKNLIDAIASSDRPLPADFFETFGEVLNFAKGLDPDNVLLNTFSTALALDMAMPASDMIEREALVTVFGEVVDMVNMTNAPEGEVYQARIETLLSDVQADMTQHRQLDANGYPTFTPDDVQDRLAHIFTGVGAGADHFQNAVRPDLFTVTEEGDRLLNPDALKSSYHLASASVFSDIRGSGIGADLEVQKAKAVIVDRLYEDMGLALPAGGYENLSDEHKKVVDTMTTQLYMSDSGSPSEDIVARFTNIWSDLAVVASADPDALATLITRGSSLWWEEQSKVNDQWFGYEGNDPESGKLSGLYEAASRAAAGALMRDGNPTLMRLAERALIDTDPGALESIESTISQTALSMSAGVQIGNETLVIVGDELSKGIVDGARFIGTEVDEIPERYETITNDRSRTITAGLDQIEIHPSSMRDQSGELFMQLAENNIRLNDTVRATIANMEPTFGNSLRVAAIRTFIDEGNEVTPQRLSVFITDLIAAEDNQLMSAFEPAASSGGRITLTPVRRGGDTPTLSISPKYAAYAFEKRAFVDKPKVDRVPANRYYHF